jgi:pimeloyl-ACP methyl ester carboxylesterase
MKALMDRGFVELPDQRLEYRMIGPRPDEAPTLVLLHEGLGSADLWGELPEKLVAATGAGVFAYSRQGYGQSGPAALPRPLDYMQHEGARTLPRLLDAIGFRRGLLVGHSDGASIAAVCAGSAQDHRLCGAVLIAPHFIVEDVTIRAITEFRDAYDHTDLRERLSRWHADVDHTVHGWSDVWLKGNFRAWDISDVLAYVRVPLLIIQGEHDQYGTAKQIEIALEECYCPVEVALLPHVMHAPHREAPDETLRLISEFANALLRDHVEDTTWKI